MEPRFDETELGSGEALVGVVPRRLDSLLVLLDAEVLERRELAKDVVTSTGQPEFHCTREVNQYSILHQ
jgi:hypothetical protein